MKLSPIILFGLAACASDPTTFTDAGPVDASSNDGSTATATVTVHVRSLAGDGVADPTATVFLVGPDGQVEGGGHADAGGTFTGLITPGGSVTVGWPDATIHLETVAGVADRDELWFGSDDANADQQLTLTVPQRAGATSYAVRGPCMTGAANATAIATRYSSLCGPTHPVLVEARTNAMPSVFLLAPTVTPTPGATVGLAGAWVPTTTAAVSITGMPAGSSDLVMSRTVEISGAETARDFKFGLAITSGMASAIFNAPAGVGDGARIDVTYRLPSDRFYTVELFRPTLTEAAPLDVAPTVPAITTVAQDGATVRWTVVGSGAYDAIVADLVDVGPNENELAHWRLVAPRGSTSFAFPDLAAPFDQSSIPLDRVRLFETTTITDPAGFRAHAGAGTWIDQPPSPAPADARWILRDADQ